MRNIRAQRAVRIDPWCTKFRHTETVSSSGWQPWYIHWRRWRQASASAVNVRAATLTTLPFLRDNYLQQPPKTLNEQLLNDFLSICFTSNIFKISDRASVYIYIHFGFIYIYGCLGAEQGTSRCMDQWWLAKWCINIRDQTWRDYVYADTTRWCILCEYINSLRPTQNGRLFADDTFKPISSIETSFFRLKFHWNFFPRFQLTISQHWFRWWLHA